MPSTTFRFRRSVPNPERHPSRNAEATVKSARVPWHPIGWANFQLLLRAGVHDVGTHVPPIPIVSRHVLRALLSLYEASSIVRSSRPRNPSTRQSIPETTRQVKVRKTVRDVDRGPVDFVCCDWINAGIG